MFVFCSPRRMISGDSTIIILSMMIIVIDAQREVIHPKGNSIIYDERSVHNFDFKRLSQSPSINNNENNNNQQSIAIASSTGTTTTTTTNSYPKSINDKIKSVLVHTSPTTTSTSAIADRERFYQQVIPKITSMIFNTKPSILNNDENTIVHYRSPMTMSKNNVVTPLNIGFNSASSPSSSLFSSPIKRMIEPPKSIQFVHTNNIPALQQQQQSWKTIDSLKRSMNNKLSAAATTQQQPPLQTYMTLSFEESSIKNDHHKQPTFYYKSTTKQGKSKQGRRSLSSPMPPNMMSKVMSYYQQTLNSDPTNSDDSNNDSSRSTSSPKTSMTLTFQDPNGSSKSQTSSKPTIIKSDSIDDQKIDWKKSIVKYAKEFGFETPYWSQMMDSGDSSSSFVDSNDENDHHHHHHYDHENNNQNAMLSRAVSTISFANDDIDQQQSPNSNYNRLYSRFFLQQNDQRSNQDNNQDKKSMMMINDDSIPSDLFSTKTTNAHQLNGDHQPLYNNNNDIDQVVKRFYSKHNSIINQ